MEYRVAQLHGNPGLSKRLHPGFESTVTAPHAPQRPDRRIEGFSPQQRAILSCVTPRRTLQLNE